MPEILFDCCVISNFALADALGVIEALYSGSAMITDFVAAEVRRGIQAGHAELSSIPAAIRSGWLSAIGLGSAEEKRLFESLSLSLGLGEASSLAVAHLRGCQLASDDLVARREARALGIKLTGTVGILRKAVEAGLLDRRTADRHLKKMVEHGFYSPAKSISGR
jgi:predicted nucleic acid-binding protein